ncbi:hypothetical protein E9993_04600 [Labilibacter sediminis]|nr:hypothetical protein E9993_04600 [Labilibacter sediminis]
MRKAAPFIILLILIVSLVGIDYAEKKKWTIDWALLNKKVTDPLKSEEAVREKNKPYIHKEYFNNDPQRGVYKQYSLMVNDEGKTIKHGETIRYTANGKVASRMYFVHNKREGKCLTYHSNGKIWKEQMYINGELSGLCKRYDKYGKLSAEYEYKQGMPGTGLKEYTNLQKLRKNPTLKTERTDLIRSLGKYKLKFSLEGKNARRYKEVKYYMGELIENKYFNHNMSHIKELDNKTAELELKVPKGYSINETFNVVAVAKNQDGLTLIIQKKVSVGVRRGE